MKVSDMKVGDTLYLGKLLNPSTAVVNDLLWVKVSSDNHFMLEQSSGYPRMQMDEKEPQSASRLRRARGNAFYPQTAIAQWLNASEAGWYTPFGDTDVPPKYARHTGFLSLFSNQERAVLQEQQITVVVPNGYKRENGAKAEMKCLVALPSLSQIAAVRQEDDKLMEEGQAFEYFMHDRRPYASCLLRTSIDGYALYTDAYHDVRYSNTNPYVDLYISPVIQAKADVEVDGVNGCFCLVGMNTGVFTASELDSIWLQ